MSPSVNGYRFGIATASLGFHAEHTLERKFAAIQQAGFQYAGLGFENYVDWVRQHHPDLPASTCPEAWCEGGEPDPADDGLWTALYDSAKAVKELAAAHGLTIVALQPLNQFDGWPEGHPRREWSRRKAERWLPLCSLLGIEMLQVGSNDKPDASTDLDVYAGDMRWIAELGAKQSSPVKIAYECWCFAHHVNTWELTWDIIQRADHPNLGLCLDVAHFPLSPSYGWDPVTGKGFTDEQFDALLGRLRAVPADKIVYLELSDMVVPDPPLYAGSVFDHWAANNKAPRDGDRFIWTICGRPVPLVGRNAGTLAVGEAVSQGARVVEALRAILSTGFKGTCLFEFFEAEVMALPDVDVPARYATASAQSLAELVPACFT
ncbi:hypothetical protein Q5752_006746 [Cryptotrichosporon argae]